MNKTICLIDGSGYIFRAFYALPMMTDPSGTPVNAVYGFTNMFLKLTNSIKCDYMLVLFDAKRQNFRNEIFADYKATRGETPIELIPQFPLIREAVEALNLNQLEMEGYEADDLIATYAKMAEDAGLDVVVVSADKDLMQLIDGKVQLYDPMKGKFFTPEDVKEKFGVFPNRVVDVQALAGDAIDNVPGVPGIGIKTAAELINQFGSLEEVLQNAEQIKQNKRRELLINHADSARISLELVRLKNDVPVEHDFTHYSCKKPEEEKIMKFIDAHAFKAIRPRVEKWLAEQCGEFDQKEKDAEIKTECKIISAENELAYCVAEIQKNRMFALKVDGEGNGFINTKINGISIAFSAGKSCYIKLKNEDVFSAKTDDLFAVAEKKSETGISFQTFKKHFSEVFSSPYILKIGAGIKEDMHLLRKIFDYETEILPIDDVSVMSYVLDGTSHPHDIRNMAKEFLDFDKFEEETEEDVHLKNLCFEADITLRLHQKLKERLLAVRQTAVYENFDRPLVSVLQKMEEQGILVDDKALVNLKREFELEMQKYEDQIYEIAGEKFNLGSPKQIADILYNKIGLKGKKTAKGSFKTGADILEELADQHELPAKILEWRTYAKLKSTYTDSILDVLDKNKRVHTTFSQITVNTGRLSSFNPNLQNIPVRTEEGRKIRSVFVAPEGYKILSADYSQVELRLMAEVANVKLLKETFEKGIDVHAATAARVFDLPYEHVDSLHRRQAKAINFGIIYGISAYGLAKQIGSTPDAAKLYIDNYFVAMPEIKTYMEETVKFAVANGYVLTPFGRKCVIYGINDNNKRTVSFAERAAINAPIQGGAADMIKLAMIRVNSSLKELGLKSKLLLQIHDELVLQAPDEEVETVSKLLHETMENVVKVSVDFPVEIGVGKNWGDAH